jgi:DNA repair exonuclease SbcCD nuclease subunit
MKFVHSADWQLGARFAQFAEKAPRLRATRVQTLSRALTLAAERNADAFLIAGDLFEDNHVENELVDEVVALFADYPDLAILISPGNHDPYSGPDSIWDRKQFLEAPPHIRVFREPGSWELNGVHFVASPLQQKVSTLDPSLRLQSLAGGLPAETIKVGMTHGAIAIPGKHQANDFPISLDAASRAGLDYLAVGHWHQWQLYDDDRLVMPGTPEPDNFGQDQAGHVAFVELTEQGEKPLIEKVSVRSMSWDRLSFDLMDEAQARRAVQSAIDEAPKGLENTVFRIVLTGAVTPDQLDAAKAWLKEQMTAAFICQVRDESEVMLSSAELEVISQEHPLVDQVLRDLESIQRLLGGKRDSDENQKVADLNLSELQALLDEARIPLSELGADHLKRARQSVIHKLRESMS